MENLENILNAFRTLKLNKDYLSINELSLFLHEEFFEEFSSCEKDFLSRYQELETQFNSNFSKNYDFLDNKIVFMHDGESFNYDLYDFEKLLVFLDFENCGKNKELCELFISNEYSTTLLNLIISDTNSITK